MLETLKEIQNLFNETLSSYSFNITCKIPMTDDINYNWATSFTKNGDPLMFEYLTHIDIIKSGLDHGQNIM